MKRLIKERWGYYFLIPWAVFFLIFTLYPFVFGIYVSFTNYSLSGMDFIGLTNYIKIFTEVGFQRSAIATISYAAIIIPFVVILSLWIAYEIHERSNTFSSFVKASFYLPGVVTHSALTIVWKFMFLPAFGMVAVFLAIFGYYDALLDDPSKAIPIISFLIVFIGLGQPIILYVAAMNNIPSTYYEAARIDGAGRIRIFWNVTLPLINTTSTYVIVTQTIGILQLFVVPYLMTGGAPAYRTSTLLLQIYDSAFIFGSFGYAAAIGNLLFVFTSILAVVQFTLLKRESVEY